MTIQQLTRTETDETTNPATNDAPQVVTTDRTRRTVLVAGACALGVGALVTTAVLVGGRPVAPDVSSAVTGWSAPTVGEAVHGGPGSQRDAQAAAYAGLAQPGAEGPTAHGGAGTISVTDGIRLHRSGYVALRRPAPVPTASSSATPDRSRIDRLVTITTP